MKTVYAVLVVFLSFAVLETTHGQTREERQRMKGYINPQEIVSLDSAWSMAQALGVLNEMSKEHAGKVIVDLEKSKKPIGVTIVNQHWRDALETILKYNGLWYTEEADFIRIVPANEGKEGAGGPAGPGGVPAEKPPTLESKDIRISAAFFNTNVSKLQNYGISWDFFRPKQSNQPDINAKFSSGIGKSDLTDTLVESFVVGGSNPPKFTFANIDALVKFFGSNNLGEMTISPEVIVRNGKQGRIQIGEDIYITTRDFAGNTIYQQVSTGTIIDVKPVIFTENDTDFIALDMKIEQSNVNADKSINKTTVNTYSLLYDGEETVIGGLYSTVDETDRSGVPILRDLPWWFLGLRYIFGSESITKSKQELIVLIKAELLPDLRTRIGDRMNNQNLLEKKRKEFQKKYDIK